MQRPVDRVVDLLDPSLNQLHNLDLTEARRRVMSGDAESVRAIDGSFALVTIDGLTVRMARSLDRPMRYFLAKRHEGPALFVADRIDTLAPRARRTPVSTGSSIRLTRGWCRPTILSSSRSLAVPIPIRSTPASSLLGEPACRRISTRSESAMSARWPTRSRNGCGRIDRADHRGAHRREFFGRHRQRLRVPR